MKCLLYSFVLALSLCHFGHAEEAEPHPISRVKETDITKRVEAFSALFLGRPYAFDGGLGEGEHGEFDQNPMVRFDEFHCVTFLETVIALSISKTEPQFERNLKRIRYKDSKVSFQTRNHFPCLDWIPNNIRNGILEDITLRVAGRPLAVAKAMVDRKGWYEFMQPHRIVMPDANEATKQAALEKLHAAGKHYKPVLGQVHYIPFEYIFPQTRATPEAPLDNQVAPDEELLKRIPSGTIVNMVRPNWNVLKIIGTRMNVSHQGFLIWRDGTLFLRHAKMEPAKKIVDEPFVDYLRRAMTIKSLAGIHLLHIQAKSRTGLK